MKQETQNLFDLVLISTTLFYLFLKSLCSQSLPWPLTRLYNTVYVRPNFQDSQFLQYSWKAIDTQTLRKGPLFCHNYNYVRLMAFFSEQLGHLISLQNFRVNLDLGIWPTIKDLQKNYFHENISNYQFCKNCEPW